MTFDAVSVGCVRAGVGRGVGVAVGTLVGVTTVGVVAIAFAGRLRLFRRGRVEAVRGRSASPSPRTERPGVVEVLLATCVGVGVGAGRTSAGTLRVGVGVGVGRTAAVSVGVACARGVGLAAAVAGRSLLAAVNSLS
jgi:hypothetical protein